MAVHAPALLLLVILGCVTSSRILPSGLTRKTAAAQRKAPVIDEQRDETPSENITATSDITDPSHDHAQPAQVKAHVVAEQRRQQQPPPSPRKAVVAAPAAVPEVVSVALHPEDASAMPGLQMEAKGSAPRHVDAAGSGNLSTDTRSSASLAQASVQASPIHQPVAKEVPLPIEHTEAATKVNRNLVIGGIAIGLIFVIGCGCLVVDRFLKPAARDKNSALKKGSSASSEDSSMIKKVRGFDEAHGERKQHIHHGHVIYEWDQSPAVVTIYTKVPEGLSKNDMEIKISSTRLQVGCKGKPAFMKEETYAEVNDQESAWRLRSNGELQIYLQKARRAEWPCALQHKATRSVASIPESPQETEHKPTSWFK